MNNSTPETAKEAARRLSAPMLDKGFKAISLHTILMQVVRHLIIVFGVNIPTLMKSGFDHSTRTAMVSSLVSRNSRAVSHSMPCTELLVIPMLSSIL